MDITYIRMARGFVYLGCPARIRSAVAYCRSRVSITMEAAFCVGELEDARAGDTKSESLDTDQAAQFTGSAFTGVCSKTTLRSAWMARALGETTSSLSGFGAALQI